MGILSFFRRKPKDGIISFESAPGDCLETKLLLNIDSHEVAGQVTRRTPGEIEVKITKPYENISMRTQIPHFARPFTDLTAEWGNDVAKKLLENIYRICEMIYANLEELTEQYLTIKKRIDDLKPARMNVDRFREAKKRLKKNLKKGMIDNIEYQKRLISIRKQRRSFELEKMRMWDSFFEECLLDDVPPDMRKDVLRIVAENANAKLKQLL